MMTDVDDHCNPSVRYLDIERHGSVNCGFHLTRSKWDPYPWVSVVDPNSPADAAGVKPGDCLVEVNGEDVIGKRICEIADIVRSRPKQVSLLLWNAGTDSRCSPESLCCGPMPLNMQRLSVCMTSVLSAMECPICLDTILPPASQCTNGHLICTICYAKSERCAVCRIRLNKVRSLFTDHVYNSLIDAFELRKESDEKKRRNKINEIFRLNKKNKKIPQIHITQTYTSKFLSNFIEKSSSAENLNQNFLAPHTSSGSGQFDPNLRKKSLSASEISSRRFHYNNGISSSCCRSCGSLDKNNDVNNLHYFCPFYENCNELIKGDVIQHFQTTHNGPLIQYFQSKFTFHLLNCHNNTYCILHETGKYFFLRINTINQTTITDEHDCVHDILIWMWLLDEQRTANEFKLHVVVYYETNPDKILLSLNSGIFSLHNISWEEMKNMKKGVFISSDTLRALCQQSRSIMLDVEII